MGDFLTFLLLAECEKRADMEANKKHKVRNPHSVDTRGALRARTLAAIGAHGRCLQGCRLCRVGASLLETL